LSELHCFPLRWSLSLPPLLSPLWRFRIMHRLIQRHIRCIFAPAALVEAAAPVEAAAQGMAAASVEAVTVVETAA